MWKDHKHSVENITSKKDFRNCNIKDTNHEGYNGPHNFTFPEDGFKQEVGVYYIVCGVDSHCYYGMKIKITVKENCP